MSDNSEMRERQPAQFFDLFSLLGSVWASVLCCQCNWIGMARAKTTFPSDENFLKTWYMVMMDIMKK